MGFAARERRRVGTELAGVLLPKISSNMPKICQNMAKIPEEIIVEEVLRVRRRRRAVSSPLGWSFFFDESRSASRIYPEAARIRRQRVFT